VLEERAGAGVGGIDKRVRRKYLRGRAAALSVAGVVEARVCCRVVWVLRVADTGGA
jgi:hypothetical protein